MAEIRNASILDIEPAIELGRAMHAESWFSAMPYDPEHLRALLPKVIARGFFVVAYEGGELVGFMLAVVAPSWFGPAITTGDLALYVIPEKRGGSLAARMVKRYIDWAMAIGASDITIGVSTGVDPERTGRFYEGMGFTHVGGVYKMRGAV